MYIDLHLCHIYFVFWFIPYLVFQLPPYMVEELICICICVFVYLYIYAFVCLCICAFVYLCICVLYLYYQCLHPPAGMTWFRLPSTSLHGCRLNSTKLGKLNCEVINIIIKITILKKVTIPWSWLNHDANDHYDHDDDDTNDNHRRRLATVDTGDNSFSEQQLAQKQ